MELGSKNEGTISNVGKLLVELKNRSRYVEK